MVPVQLSWPDESSSQVWAWPTATDVGLQKAFGAASPSPTRTRSTGALGSSSDSGVGSAQEPVPARQLNQQMVQSDRLPSEARLIQRSLLESRPG